MDGKQLKNSILQWAIQGKLVPQNPKDEPASKLLERIALSRHSERSEESSKRSKKASTSLRGAKATKQSKNPTSRIYRENGVWYEQVGTATPKDISDEIPFEIPENWAWCRLGEMGNTITGSTPSKLNPEYIGSDIPFLSPGDISLLNKIISYDSQGLSLLGKSVARPVPPQTILQVCIGGSIGKCAVVDREVCFNQQINSITLEEIDYKYVYEVLQSKIFQDLMKSKSTGTATPIINKGAWDLLMFPLPPLAEQKRIVAKLEQVLPLAEEYGAAQEQLDKLNKELPEALKKSILQEAIQGKLVPQNPKDGCGNDLAKKLIEAKKRLISCGKIPNKAETKPFFTQEDLDAMPIPESWCWVQLSNVSIIQEGAGIRKNQYRNSGTQILCVTNILEGKVDLEKKQLFISTEEYLEKYKHLTLNHGDIVTSCSGGSWGKTACFYAEKTMMLNTSTLRLRFFDDLADNNYLYYLCKTPFFKKQLEQQLSGMQPNFGYAHYSRIIIPLPPLAEQKRIVAKLEQLFKVL